MRGSAPTLSVVLANYNDAWHLPESLHAILAESYEPTEIIVVDDASTDNSVEVIERFLRKSPLIRLIRNRENQGTVACARLALGLSSGEYVYFGAADDKVLPGLFEKSIELLTRYPQASLCSAIQNVVDEEGKYLYQFPLRRLWRTECFISPADALRSLRRYGSWIAGTTCIIRRRHLMEIGGLLPELHAFCDGFVYMVLPVKYGACFVPAPLGVWRQASRNYSARSTSSLEVSLGMWSFAAQLLRTKYSELFPEDFVRSWEEQRFFHARLSAYNRLLGQQAELLKGLLARPTIVDRAFFLLMSLGARLHLCILAFYLLARRGRHIWPVLAQGGVAQVRRALAEVRSGRIVGEREPRSRRPVKLERSR